MWQHRRGWRVAVGAWLIAAAVGAWWPPTAEAAGEDEQPIVLAEDGGWGYAGRHAVVGQGKLFFSYLDQAGHTWVGSYDFETGQVVRNRIWEGDADLHSSNPLFIRPDGRVQVFVDTGGYVDRQIRWKVSVEPWSVAEFGELQESELEGDVIQGRQFYPLVHEASGAVYLIINALRDDQTRKTVMWKSPDGGDTWREYHNLWALGKGLAGNRCYTRAYLAGDDIHFVTLRVGWGEPLDDHEIGRVEGVYYTRFDVEDETFHRADGSRGFGMDELPVYETEPFDEIWHWQSDGDGKQRAVWSDIVADDRGRPYVAFAVQDAVEPGTSALHDGHWATPDANGQWRHHRVATLARGWDNTPERKNYAIAIDPADPHVVFVARSTSEAEDLSQVQRMVTEDGGATWRSSRTISGEGRLTTVVVPRVLDETDRVVDVLWLQGRMEGWRDYETRVLTRGAAAED